VLPLRLHGALDVDAVAAALADLGGRHEALRHSRLGSAGTRLRSLGPDDHLLELALPTARVDLWSHLPLAAEFARAYAARRGGAEPVVAPAPPEAAPRAISGDTLPTALPGSAPGDDDLGQLTGELDSALHDRLTRFATGHGATVFMVVHAALTALIARLGADGEITVAAPVPARDSGALRGGVGAYERVLALSVDVAGDPTFTELVRRTRERDLAAYRSAQAALALPGGVALAVLQEPVGQFAAAELTVRPQQPQLPPPAADLGIVLTERQTPAGACAGFAVTTTYRRRTIGEQAAAILTGQLTGLLTAAIDTPGTPLAALPPTGRHDPAPGTAADPYEPPTGQHPQAPPAAGVDELFPA
jgi:pristinamycin I synthase-3/4